MPNIWEGLWEDLICYGFARQTMLALKEKKSNEEPETGAEAAYLWLAGSHVSPPHIGSYRLHLPLLALP